jgi:hypothetical protein
MKRFALGLMFALWSSIALAQGCGPSNPNCIVPTAPPGTSNNQAASTAFVQTAIPLGAITALTGPVTATGPGSAMTAIGAGVVANSNLANMAAGTVKGSIAGGAPSDLTGAQTESILQFTQSGTGAVQRTLDAKIKENAVSVLDFGADPTRTNDSATAFNNAFAAAVAAKKALYIPAGAYRLASQLLWDLHTCCSNFNAGPGITILGDGYKLAILDFSIDSVASPNFKLFSSVSENLFNVRFGNFGIITNVNGIAMQLGQLAANDNIDLSQFDPIHVQFFSAGASSVAYQINSVQSSLFTRWMVTWPSTGSGLDSFQLRNVVQSTFLAPHAFGGTNVIHLTGSGNVGGNVFVGPLFEASTNGLIIDCSSCSFNSFLGPVFNTLTTGVNTTASTFNLISNPFFTVVTTPFSGIVGLTGDVPWQSFTANPICGNAAITTNSAKTRTNGKTTSIELDINITVLGTCTNNMIFTLPNTPNSGAAVSGRAAGSNKGVVIPILSGSTTAGGGSQADGTNFVTGQIVMSGVYENQ